jgi:hypothetical protein
VSTTCIAPCPLKIGLPSLETEKYCVPRTMVKFVVRIPARSSTVTGSLPPLATAKVAGLVSRVVTNMTPASKLIPFSGGNGSIGHCIAFEVVLYQ